MKILTEKGNDIWALISYNLRVVVNFALVKYHRAVGDFATNSVEIELLPAQESNIRTRRAQAFKEGGKPATHSAQMVIVKHVDKHGKKIANHPVLLHAIQKAAEENAHRGIIAVGEIIAVKELQELAQKTSEVYKAENTPVIEEKNADNSEVPKEEENAPKRTRKPRTPKTDNQ